VSVEAISWALNLAPVPVDPSGKPNSACAFVLVGLANHASPDGTAAFPSTHTLIRYTRLSERTVRTALDRLQAAGIITPCDPGIVAAHIHRADRRPQGWNLNLALIRDDLTDEDITTLERQYPGLRARLTNGVQLTHPERVATVNGVQLTQERGATDAERGAAVAPKPSIEPPLEPSLSPLNGGERHDDGALFSGPPPAAPSLSVLFDRFWAAYPKHTGKQYALKKFQISIRTVDPEVIITAAAAYAAHRAGQDPKYTKDPGTWLNKGCWDDELDQQPEPEDVGGLPPWELLPQRRP
jgi:Helix-turn-helix domain